MISVLKGCGYGYENGRTTAHFVGGLLGTRIQSKFTNDRDREVQKHIIKEFLRRWPVGAEWTKPRYTRPSTDAYY